jgi:hypothetical protein
MSDLDLMHQLGNLLGRPLEQLSEDQFERHAQARATWNWDSQNLIKRDAYFQRDAYSLGADGTVSGLFLQPVTSQLLL